MVNKSRFAMENKLLDVPEDPVTFFFVGVALDIPFICPFLVLYI